LPTRGDCRGQVSCLCPLLLPVAVVCRCGPSATKLLLPIAIAASIVNCYCRRWQPNQNCSLLLCVVGKHATIICSIARRCCRRERQFAAVIVLDIAVYCPCLVLASPIVKIYWS
jgi:hypothetical protein